MTQENYIRFRELNRGLSGCAIKLSNSGNLIKQSASIFYNQRLENQSNKQKYFSKFNFENIKIPKVIDNYFEEQLFCIEMEYIHAENEINFFNHAAPFQVEEVKNTFCNYFEILSKEAIEYDFSEDIYQKLISLRASSQYSSIIDSLLNFSEKKRIILPKTFCHGDLTMANMLFQKRTIYFLDFLDSYIDSFLCDIIKLKQDLYYLWNLNLSGNNNLRIKIIYKKLWESIYSSYFDYLESPELKLLNILNFLRIEPYVNSKKLKLFLDCIIMELNDEFKCII